MFNLLLPTNYAKQIRGSRDKHILLETNDIEMPWELMHDGKNFLCLKHHIGRSLVTESLEPIRNSTEFESQPTDKKDVEIAIIVDPSEDLPATKVERTLADKLEGFGKVDVFEGRDFTSVKAIKVFGRESYDIIHYAGHARFDKDNPFNSSLKLYDGKISAEDIAKAVSKNTYKPHLLFINACTSARHIDHKQEIEYVGHKSVGLASLLLRYGIQAYVGALWNIYDESAANFALEFYKRVLENQTFGSAMTDARRLTFTESKGRDLTWSSFVLYGNPITKLSQK